VELSELTENPEWPEKFLLGIAGSMNSGASVLFWFKINSRASGNRCDN